MSEALSPTPANAVAISERIQEVKGEIAELTARDGDFRAALLADPQAAIEKEYGLDPGELKDLKLNVVVEEAGTLVITIPPDMSEMELTDDQLDQVAGGAAFIAGVAAVTAAVVSVGTAAAGVASRTREGSRW